MSHLWQREVELQDVQERNDQVPRVARTRCVLRTPLMINGKSDFQTAWVVMAPALWFDDHVLLG
jgi:hypothetical protein